MDEGLLGEDEGDGEAEDGENDKALVVNCKL